MKLELGFDSLAKTSSSGLEEANPCTPFERSPNTHNPGHQRTVLEHPRGPDPPSPSHRCHLSGYPSVFQYPLLSYLLGSVFSGLAGCYLSIIASSPQGSYRHRQPTVGCSAARGQSTKKRLHLTTAL